MQSTRAPHGAGAGEEGDAVQSHLPTRQRPLRPGVSTAGDASHWRHSCQGWGGVGAGDAWVSGGGGTGKSCSDSSLVLSGDDLLLLHLS